MLGFRPLSCPCFCPRLCPSSRFDAPVNLPLPAGARAFLPLYLAAADYLCSVEPRVIALTLPRLKLLPSQRRLAARSRLSRGKQE